MEIQTLKDLKLALKDVPDEALEEFGAGFSEDDKVQLLVYCEEEKFDEKWKNIRKVCPAIDDVDKWIQNISKVTKKLGEDDHYEGFGNENPISSEDKL